MNKIDKVAVVSSVLPATNYSAYLIQALQKRYPQKVEVLVYTSKRRENLQAPLRNIKLVWDKNILYIFQIWKQVLRDKPQIVHLQHEINMFGGLLTAALFPLLPISLKITGTKTITTIHAVVSKKDINKEFLETFFKSQKEFLQFPIELFFSFLYKTTGLFSDKIVVHTKGLKSILVNDYRLNKNKIVVIPHGVPDKIQIDRRYQPTGGWVQTLSLPFILTYGYLHKRKGLKVLIRSFPKVIKELPELILVIAGGTLQKDYELRLKSLVKKLKLEKKVIFTGFIEVDNLRWLLKECRFVLLPARYSISASGPLAQAIAHYKPVIASNVGVFGKEINHGVDGLLAKNSLKDWAKQIKKLIKDKALYKKITANLRKKHQLRKWSRIAKATYDLYQKVLEE